MNISYSRSESAPYSATTASGLTTLPRLLDILYARLSSRMLGSSPSTKLSPCFCRQFGRHVDRRFDAVTWNVVRRRSLVVDAGETDPGAVGVLAAGDAPSRPGSFPGSRAS